MSNNVLKFSKPERDPAAALIQEAPLLLAEKAINRMITDRNNHPAVGSLAKGFETAIRENDATRAGIFLIALMEGISSAVCNEINKPPKG